MGSPPEHDDTNRSLRDRLARIGAATIGFLRRAGAYRFRNAPAVVVASASVVAVLLATSAVALTGVAGDVVRAPTEAVAGFDRVPRASVLTDAEGEPFARIYDQYRRPVDASEIAEEMKAATVAIEDRRFYDHSGVDVTGIARALVENTVAGGNPLSGQGASTITMQYVKNHRLYVNAETAQEQDAAVAVTLGRKLLDARAALAVEQQLTKPEILAQYLNTVYFGNGAYGIAAAARTYFDTTPAELTLSQSALLAAVIRAPGRFDPVDAPDAATARRDLVLASMVEVGSATPAAAASARDEPLGVVEPLLRATSGCEGADPGTGFFCAHVLGVLTGNGIGMDALRTGGYTVRTTLDRAASTAATAAAAELVPTGESPGIANAVAVVEPGEGRRVLALAANHEFGPDADAGQSSFPLPSAPVPYGAGSTYKIFTAAAALEAGIDLRTPFPAPESYTSRTFDNGEEPYTVTGANGASSTVTLQEALALSPNTTFVAVLDALGSVDPVVDMAYRLGMRNSLAVPAGTDATVGEAVRAEERASFTLGPVPAIPLELANVGATIMSGGVWCPPTAVESVTDGAGQAVALERAACERVVPQGLADTLAVGLSGGATSGTAAGAAGAAGWERPMLAKTGTTQDSRSAAFVGATPQLSAAVLTWSDESPPRAVCGSDPPRLCDRGNLSGGGLPARTWYAAMGPLHEGLDVAPLPAPDPRYLGRVRPPPPAENQDENPDENPDENQDGDGDGDGD